MTKTITVKGRRIGENEPVFLTAEIGAAHEGDFERCKHLMRVAKEAGWDGTDIFCWDPATYIHHDYEILPVYDSLLDEIAKLQFTDKQWRELFRFADELGIILYCTPLGEGAIERALAAGAPMLNINSDDLNDLRFLRKIAKAGVPLTMHDINATLGEVEMAVTTLLEHGCQDLILLHSTLEANDPVLSYEGANMRMIETYRRAFEGSGVLAGCVEHTTSKFLIYAVAALPAVLISKHMILNHDDKVADSSISFEASEMADIINNVRRIEQAMGTGSPFVICEKDGKLPWGNVMRRKVLVCARNIAAGETLSHQDFMAKRPGHMGGLHPWYGEILNGAKAKVDMPVNTIVDLNMVEDYLTPEYRPYKVKQRCYNGDYVGP